MEAWPKAIGSGPTATASVEGDGVDPVAAPTQPANHSPVPSGPPPGDATLATAPEPRSTAVKSRQPGSPPGYVACTRSATTATAPCDDTSDAVVTGP